MKQFRLPLILMLALLVLGSIGGYWHYRWRYLETTDNAYVRGDITPISSRVTGMVGSVMVADNQVVAAGEPLIQIEAEEFEVLLEQGRSGLVEREAALLAAIGKRKQQASKIVLARSQRQISEIELKNETVRFARLEQLYLDKMISPLDYDTALAKTKRCRAELAGAEASLQMVEHELTALIAEEKRIAAEINQHRQELQLLQQDLVNTCIRAPISGTVGNRRVRPGQYVREGSVLLALIPLEDVWVEANFKEVQLSRMRQGQPVAIEVDAFPQRRFAGRIESLSPASGAEFSILPPENASGNFTKIVQRVPVKISLDKSQLANIKLLPGMSVEVEVDTRFDDERWDNDKSLTSHSGG
jgi:membrane fusion protein (multidrug efflux system)